MCFQLLLAVCSALVACASANINTAQYVATAREFMRAVTVKGVQHIVVTDHIDLRTLLSPSAGTLVQGTEEAVLEVRPLQAKISTATIRVCYADVIF
jgi:hypothetical protein